MVKSFVIPVLFILMGGLCVTGFAQEIQFSQYNDFPLYLNPALTGHIRQQRIAFISRSQWVNIDGAFDTKGFSYDYNLGKLKSGLGLVVVQDETSGGGLTTFNVGGLYAYHLRISRTFFLNFGVRVAYNQQRLDPSNLTFADQLIRNDGSATVEVFDNLVHDFMDYSWGNVLFYIDSVNAKNYWLGISLNHLNRPKIPFQQYKGILPVAYLIHGGGRYLLNKDLKGFPTSVISFSFLYKSQLKWDQAELGASYILSIPGKQERIIRKKKKKRSKPKFIPTDKQFTNFTSLSETQMPKSYLEGGLSYRGIPLLKKYKPGYMNHEAMIILFALSYNDIKITYTFDITISKLGLSNSAGAHEVSLVYQYIIPHSGKKGKYVRKSLF